MVHLAIKEKLRTFKKYIRMYLILVKYSAQVDFTYWGNLSVSILVEFFYQIAFFAFFAVVMTKTQTIGGWNASQMIVLLGIDTLTSEFLTGMVIVWNSRELPYKIWNGELDRILLRPIHPLFTLSLGRPYFPSFVSAITGVILIIIGLSQSSLIVNPLWILGSILFFSLGFIIVYSIVIMFSLLTFFFQDTWTLPKIGERVVYSFTSRPHTIFNGFLKFVFYFIFPVVYVSSFSTDTLFNGINYTYLFFAFCLAVLFLIGLNIMWKKALKSYSSASS